MTPSVPGSIAVPAALRAHAAPLAALLLGAALVLTIGFAPLPSIHDAAHDARHAAGYPCH